MFRLCWKQSWALAVSTHWTPKTANAQLCLKDSQRFPHSQFCQLYRSLRHICCIVLSAIGPVYMPKDIYSLSVCFKVYVWGVSCVFVCVCVYVQVAVDDLKAVLNTTIIYGMDKPIILYDSLRCLRGLRLQRADWQPQVSPCRSANIELFSAPHKNNSDNFIESWSHMDGVGDRGPG